MTVDFNEKLDVVYTNLNRKFEALNTHVKNLETQVDQTNEVVMRQEALIKGKGEVGQKQQTNAIIEDDFWQEVRHEWLELDNSLPNVYVHQSRITPPLRRSAPSLNQEYFRLGDSIKRCCTHVDLCFPTIYELSTVGKRKWDEIADRLMREANKEEMDAFIEKFLSILREEEFYDFYHKYAL